MTRPNKRRGSGPRHRAEARWEGRNIRLQIEYDGSNYCGWQSQKIRRSKTIQETIEKVLRRVLQEKIRLVASGRTDAGVHARAQVANFKTCSKISPEKLQNALNGLLPEDISVSKIEEVPVSFHSCLGAKSKTYRYTILNRRFPSALLAGRVYFYPYPLDLGLMRSQAKSLLGRHDFSAFCASNSGAKSKIRTIRKISVKRKKDGLLEIEIEADGFLYNMVRNIVGTLIQIGRGKQGARNLKRVLDSKNRGLAGPCVPAGGLSLIKVQY
ncbi:MAG: tRNA pseudouridine(38-40) synthase TruA [Candidatus Omnitrophica bacterium]|nr:tRNA pseudouridine(38-40) synthase TruA [Candidatus Omnitrophota bacterium]